MCKGNMHVSVVLSLPGVMLITNVYVAIHEGRADDGFVGLDHEHNKGGLL